MCVLDVDMKCSSFDLKIEHSSDTSVWKNKKEMVELLLTTSVDVNGTGGMVS